MGVVSTFRGVWVVGIDGCSWWVWTGVVGRWGGCDFWIERDELGR